MGAGVGVWLGEGAGTGWGAGALATPLPPPQALSEAMTIVAETKKQDLRFIVLGQEIAADPMFRSLPAPRCPQHAAARWSPASINGNDSEVNIP